VERGATCLVTSGAAQSNYARLTAASARRVGLDVVLCLKPGSGTGNLTLDAVFGAEIVWDGDPQEVAASRPDAVVLPYGGSSELGARGYVTCAEEILADAPEVRHVVVAVGSGATMAGLVAGLGPERVLGVHTGAVADPHATVASFVDASGLRIDLDQAGPGYEELTEAARGAIDAAGRTEGIVLDPVYTAKAMAGLLSRIRAGEFKKNETILFWHTGGTPAFFV
jgi:D-cysteine desulfhydrase